MKSTAMSALLAALLASVIALPAAAAERERGINARQHLQQHRIQQGVRQGDLARGETRRLQREARDIRREERAFRSDGRFTTAERREVHRDLDRLSRDIYRERHDGERRFGPPPSQIRFDPQPGHPRGWAYGHRERFGGWYPGHGFGHPVTGRAIDRRQHEQMARIREGIRSGELTRREARRLLEEQRAVRAEERAYRADGRLSRAERADLWQDLNEAGRHIYNETHDAERRF